MVHFGHKVTAEHEFKVGVSLSESVVMFHKGCHLAVESL
jgi:hypothetical protein